MLADAERLHSQSLAPLARSALMKALQLRFGVLLTPAFWTVPIRRDLLKGEDLGVFAGRFEPAAVVPPHGVLMLKLTYEPEYNTDL